MTEQVSQTRVLVLTAEDAPTDALPGLPPNRRYRFPRVAIETRPIKQLVASEIRVRMLYVGICGTDLHLVEADHATGYVKTSAPAVIPAEGRIIGHEGVGKVIAVGDRVDCVEPGDIVAFSSIVSCMYCKACRQGQFNQCENASLLGMEQDGLFGNVVDVPAVLAHRVSHLVDTDKDLQAFACLEPASCALLACETADIRPGATVAIFGAGPIGLYCAMICRLVMGAANVVVIEKRKKRREFARQWCNSVYQTDEFFAQYTAGVDVVIEASGDLENVSRIIPQVKSRGCVVLLARSGMPLLIPDIDHVISQAIAIKGCRGHLGGAVNRVIELYKSGQLPLDAAVTSVVNSLDELCSALSDTESVLNGDCKILAALSSDTDA